MTLQYTIVMMVETIVSHVLVCENGTKNTIYIAFIYNININVGTWLISFYFVCCDAALGGYVLFFFHRVTRTDAIFLDQALWWWRNTMFYSSKIIKCLFVFELIKACVSYARTWLYLVNNGPRLIIHFVIQVVSKVCKELIIEMVKHVWCVCVYRIMVDFFCLLK